MTFTTEMAASAASWPQCPNCKCRDVLVMHSKMKCLSCNHSGPADALSKSPAHRYMATRVSVSPLSGHCALQYGPFPQNADAEFGDILKEKVSRLFQETLFERYLFQAREYFKKHGSFPTTAVSYSSIGTSPEARTLKDGSTPIEESIGVLRGFATVSEAMAILFAAESEQCDFSLPATEPRTICMNVHMSGTPAWPPGTRELKWSPLDWSILNPIPGKTSLRYGGAFEILKDINVTVSVQEDFDTGEARGAISMREPGAFEAKVKQAVGHDTEAMVARMKGRFAKLLATARAEAPESILFEFEREWGVERDQAAIMTEIKESDLWVKSKTI